MADYLLVSTTAESHDVAMTLARSAVEARLAASAQVYGPLRSVFWHLGELGTGDEWQVMLKTTADRYRALEEHLVAKHPWTNPEVTAIPLVEGASQYLEWLRRTVADPG